MFVLDTIRVVQLYVDKKMDLQTEGEKIPGDITTYKSSDEYCI